MGPRPLDFPGDQRSLQHSEVESRLPALLAFKNQIQGAPILLKLDNVTTVAYVRRQGGTRSSTLLREVTPIMDWDQANLQLLMAVYVPGHLNTQADYPERI